MKFFISLFAFFGAVSVIQAGSFTDSRDGQIYQTFSAGGLTWMAENLNYQQGGSYCYDNSKNNCYSDGRLYTFQSAQNACPSGWSLPSEAEAKAMLSEVNFKREFKLVAAGLRKDDDTYLNRGAYGYFWTSDGSKGKGKYFYGSTKDNSAKWLGGLQSSALSVRCVQKGGEYTSRGTSNADGFTDSRDGNIYKTVKIGRQTWMAENLNYKMEGSVCFDNLESNCRMRGRLYTNDAAMKACPSGWHLPTDGEFETMLKALGKPKCKRGCVSEDFDSGECEEYGQVCTWEGFGRKLAQKGFSTEWAGIKFDYDDMCGSDDSFSDIGLFLWMDGTLVSIGDDVEYAWDFDGACATTGHFSNYFSVRCVKD